MINIEFHNFSPASVNIDESGGVYFNDQELSDDLEGNLNGSVMFAQACIFPSRPATDRKDIRPHLVSQRDTLVLFKPLDELFDADAGVQMSIYDKKNNLVNEQSMLPPDQLPGIAESIAVDGDEFRFLEPEWGYDITYQPESSDFDDQNNLFIDDMVVLGATTIIAQVSDDGWSENIFLPEAEKSTDVLTLMTFSSISSTPFYVHYGDKRMKINSNDKMAFINLNGKWDNLFESAVLNDDAIRNFIKNKEALTIVDDKRKIKQLRSPEDGGKGVNGMIDLLQTHGSIQIMKGDYDLPREAYLPPNNPEFDGKYVVFTSISNKDTTVYYGKDEELNAISTNENNLIFLNRNGVWLEWSDALYSKIKYGKNFWSATIPQEYVLPGMSLTFKNGEKIGSTLEVEIGAPTELVLHTIDIGMLVEPRGKLDFQDNIKCQEEYYQRIPVSRLIITQYEPIHLKEVVLYDGTTYTNQSTDTGDIHNGDMREQIGKTLISTGINMANLGIHSTDGPSKAKTANPYYKTANWYTIHNSQGRYSNGIVKHGASGGGTIVTIIKTCRANEFSHELAHNWNGHYPNGFDGSVHRSSEYYGSTWGWNSDLNVFLPNFQKSVTGEDQCLCETNKSGEETCKCQESFLGHQFGKDAMAGGGGPMYPSISYFTMHTPYVLYRIQNGDGTGKKGEGIGLEKYATWDKTSPTGLIKWDTECNCMKPWSVTPEEDETDYPRKPVNIGIPVTTLVGFYDPELTMRTYIYPALHGSYGNVFEDDSEEEISKIIENGCHASVRNAKDEEKKFALKDFRQDGENMNKFHINIAETFEPVTIMINCRNQKIAERNIEKPTRALTYNVIGRPL